MEQFLLEIKNRMSQKLPGFEAQFLMASANRKSNILPPENAKQSGVLLLLFLKEKRWNLLLIQRTEDGNAHSGQISFPGGKMEKYDKDFTDTALRECEEEIGIAREHIHVMGHLTPLYIPASNFVVNPTVGFIDYDKIKISISQKEVKEVLIVPLEYLFDEQHKQLRLVKTNYQMEVKARAYILQQNQVVWGATAMILSEFEQIIQGLKFFLK